MGQNEHTLTGVDQRAFLGHQIESVPDRVDQQDVVAGQGSERPGVVVLDFEDDRGPCRCGPALVDPLHRRFDLVLVSEIVGQPLAGGIGEGYQDHPLPSVRFVVEQLVEGPEPTKQILRQLHPVDPDDDLAVGTPDFVLQGGGGGPHSRIGGRGPQSDRIGGKGGHESRDVSGVGSAVGPGKSQGLAEGGGPPRGVESAGAEFGHAWTGARC